MRRIIFTALLIAHMCLIFSFSMQSSDVSGEQSSGFTVTVLKILPFTKNLPDSSLEKIADDIDFIVRKTAHFTLYAVLGVLAYLTFSSYGFFSAEKRKKYICILCFCLLYALSDEIHQYFVPGRACRIYDVTIDFSGSAFGVCACTLIKKILRD